MNNHFFVFNVLGSRIIKDNNDIYYCVIHITKDLNSINKVIFVKLSNKLYDTYEGNEISDFIDRFNITLNKDTLLINGIDNFIPLEDYYLSNTLAEEYNIENEELILPDLLIVNSSNYINFNNDYWNYVEYINIKNYISKNIINEYSFTEEELLNLNSTFMKTILELTTFTDYSVGTNAIYKAVIDFYANGQYDDATILMNIILGGQIITTDISNCGCTNISGNCSTSSSTSTINTGTGLVPVDSASCIDIYKAAMYQWLQQMLSDINFYCCWMFSDDEENDDQIPNDELLDKLIELLKEFLSLGIDLSNLGTSKFNCGCNHKVWNSGKIINKDCPDLFDDSYKASCTNESIILNYIKVLNWIKENKIEENKNKIYIYGKQFAEIFPLLNFN